VNILNKQPLTNYKGWSSSLGVRRGAKKPFIVKNKFVTKSIKEPRTWTDSLDKRPKRRNMDIILRWILERWDGVMWTGLVWLRIGTSGELL
jgi:hypothetical protein